MEDDADDVDNDVNEVADEADSHHHHHKKKKETPSPTTTTEEPTTSTTEIETTSSTEEITSTTEEPYELTTTEQESIFSGSLASTDVDAALLLSNDVSSENIGNAALYVTFIGASILLFICAWFIKDGFKKWKMREYENVNSIHGNEKVVSYQQSDNESQYKNNGYDDWEDNYDLQYAQPTNNKKRKKKFADWNDYATV